MRLCGWWAVIELVFLLVWKWFELVAVVVCRFRLLVTVVRANLIGTDAWYLMLWWAVAIWLWEMVWDCLLSVQNFLPLLGGLLAFDSLYTSVSLLRRGSVICWICNFQRQERHRFLLSFVFTSLIVTLSAFCDQISSHAVMYRNKRLAVLTVFWIPTWELLKQTRCPWEWYDNMLMLQEMVVEGSDPTGHIISTTIGGKNGEAKRVSSTISFPFVLSPVTC